MNKEASKQLTPKQKVEVEALANLPEEAIDNSDIPEILDWSAAGRGLLYHRSRSRARAAFEPRQRRLRRQRPARHRVASRHELHHRIVRQPGGVAAVGIAAGNSEEALLKQRLKRMGDLGLLTTVRQTRRQGRAYLQLFVARLEQNRSPVGAGVILVEFGDDRFFAQTLEQNTLFGGIVWHAKALSASKWLMANTILAHRYLSPDGPGHGRHSVPEPDIDLKRCFGDREAYIRALSD